MTDNTPSCSCGSKVLIHECRPNNPMKKDTESILPLLAFCVIMGIILYWFAFSDTAQLLKDVPLNFK